MFKKSWKTTLFGLATIGTAVTLFLKGQTQEALAAFTTGVGLIFSKDFDITHKH